jgi:hypothetical protein
MCRDVQGVFCQFIVEHRIHKSWLHRRIAHQSDWSRTSTDNLCSTTLVSHLSCHLLHSTFDGASAFILSATQRPFLEFHRLPTPRALCPLPEVNHNGLIPLSTQALAVPRVYQTDSFLVHIPQCATYLSWGPCIITLPSVGAVQCASCNDNNMHIYMCVGV